MDFYTDDDYLKNHIKNITEFVPDILLSEVQAVKKKLKSNKSPGIGAITAEALRSMEQEGL